MTGLPWLPWAGQTHLVTGGAGFLGHHLVRRLLILGASVVIVDDLSTPGSRRRADLLAGFGARVILDDVLRVAGPGPSIWDLPRLDGIWHLASPASPPLYVRRQRQTLMLGTAALHALLDMATDSGARVLFASSSEVYGDPSCVPDAPSAVPEAWRGWVDPVGPRSCYDEAKRAGEAICRAWAVEGGADVRIARIHNTYGPGQDDDGRLVPRLMASALTGRPFAVHGTGRQTRCLSHVADTVDALLALWHATSLVGRPVNVGGDEELTVLEVVEAVRRATGQPIPTSFDPAGGIGQDPQRRRPDLTVLRSLGWRPRVALHEGFVDTWTELRGRSLADAVG